MEYRRGTRGEVGIAAIDRRDCVSPGGRKRVREQGLIHAVDHRQLDGRLLRAIDGEGDRARGHAAPRCHRRDYRGERNLEWV